MIIRDWCLLIAIVVMLGSIVAHAAPITGTATITLTAPAAREDGTALPAAEIAGYTLRWGTVSGIYTQSQAIKPSEIPYKWAVPVDVPIGGSTAIYFAATTTDTKGRESKPSAEAVKRFYAETASPPAMPVITSVNAWSCTPDGTGYSCSTVKP